MPALPAVLYKLISDKVADNLGIKERTSYFQEMHLAIATGIATGTASIQFTTVDTGIGGTPPVPGAGIGTGIIVDANEMTRIMYTTVRQGVIDQFGNTTHEPYPPSDSNSGQQLLGICRGISEGVAEHFKDAWTLTSVHSTVYAGSGVISRGKFSGLDANGIASLILSNSPNLKGPFWPNMAKIIAQAYVTGIQTAAEGNVTITGVCIPGVGQVCGLPQAGVGTGTAS